MSAAMPPSMGVLEDADVDFHRAEVARLRAELEAAFQPSALRAEPNAEARAALHGLLLRLRLGEARP